jgi:hypothetical protein
MTRRDLVRFFREEGFPSQYERIAKTWTAESLRRLLCRCLQQSCLECREGAGGGQHAAEEAAGHDNPGDRCAKLTGMVLTTGLWRTRGTPETFAEFLARLVPAYTVTELKHHCRHAPDVVNLIDQACSKLPAEIATTLVATPWEERTLKRVRARAPELFQRVQAGEMSAHAAIAHAGLARRSVVVPLEVNAAAEKLKTYFSREELCELAERLTVPD